MRFELGELLLYLTIAFDLPSHEKSNMELFGIVDSFGYEDGSD